MKETIDLLKALAPFLILVSILVFLRKLWYYILRDVIKDKINEIQAINKKTLKVVSRELADRKKPDRNINSITVDYFEEVREVFNEISDVAHYGSNGLATSAFLPAAMLNRVTNDDFLEVTGDNTQTIPPLEQDFKAFVANALFYIESHAIRPVSIPNGIKVYVPKWINFDFKGGFGGGEIKYIDGLEQGPYMNPLGRPAAEFFFSVLKHHTKVYNHFLHKRYFQVIGSNIVFYTFFLEKEVFFPLSFNFYDAGIFGSAEIKLISVGYNKRNNKYELMYASLVDNIKTKTNFSQDEGHEIISSCIGYPIEGVEIYDDSEVFVLYVKGEDAHKDFNRKAFGMLKEMSDILRKNYFHMCLHWILVYFLRIIKRNFVYALKRFLK